MSPESEPAFTPVVLYVAAELALGGVATEEPLFIKWVHPDGHIETFYRRTYATRCPEAVRAWLAQGGILDLAQMPGHGGG